MRQKAIPFKRGNTIELSMWFGIAPGSGIDSLIGVKPVCRLRPRHAREAVAEFAIAQGWEVRRIKIDDGCYEIDGRDATGRAIEVKLHPGTLQIVEFEFEDDDGDEREGQEND